jgi:cytochrome c-type biogenesis protein CcmF
VMMQEKRGMMKVWNMWLIFSTFLLAIFGTFLTRSGVVSSVHAFAESNIGIYFVVFMAITFAVCAFFYWRNRSCLVSEHNLESLVSRESSFLFNNVLLLVAAFAVLWGTLFPVLSEWVTGHKVTVGPPFFNKVNIPIALCLLLLTAVGPLLAWGKTSMESLRRNFLVPALIALTVGVALVAGGMKPWVDVSYFYSLMTIMLSVLVAATVGSEFFRGGRVIARKNDINIFRGMYQLTRRNMRRYGGYIVHVGVIVTMIGFAGSAFYQNNEQELGFGGKMAIGPYTLVCRSYTQDDKPNYSSEWAILDVYKNGKKITTMYPEQRFYKASGQPATIVANRSTIMEDLYLVYTGKNPDTGHPIIKAHLNPLVWWIWAGAHLILVGTLVALVPNVQNKPRRSPPLPQPAALADADEEESESRSTVEAGSD